MTKATNELVDRLSRFIDKNKYLILSGTMAVGKTYIASAITMRCALPEYDAQGQLPIGQEKFDVVTEIVPIHPSYFYEDFISGITIRTHNGQVDFQYEDKIFLKMLKAANRSWEHKENKKYFLILDDIGRGAISGILGDMLSMIEPHGNSDYRVTLRDGTQVWISPNVYIIATRSTTTEPIEQFNYGFFRHFYEYLIETDFAYMNDDVHFAFSDYDISANAMYYRAKHLISDNLRHRYQISSAEKNRYIIGHGIYKDNGTAMIMKCQVIPLLKQYVR